MGLLDNESITVKRKAAGAYVNGHYVTGAESNYSALASVQPLSGEEILQLPEADRKRESLKMFTPSEIKVNDTVTRAGRNYEVQKVMDFSAHRIPHYEAVMLLIEGQ